MSTYYFSGVDRPSFMRILAKEQCACMINRLDLSKPMIKLLRQLQLKAVIDSGAFQKNLTISDLEAYARLIIEIADCVIWFANGDVIGNQQQSNQNYFYLLSLLPAELHHKVLWIYQFGAKLDYLDEALNTHTRIGIGGLVPLIAANKKEAFSAIEPITERVAAAGVTPHYFGATFPDLLKLFHVYHSDFSVDSTTWLQAGVSKEIINRNGQRFSANIAGYDFSVEACLEQNIRTMRKWVEESKQKQPKTNPLQLSLFEEKAS